MSSRRQLPRGEMKITISLVDSDGGTDVLAVHGGPTGGCADFRQRGGLAVVPREAGRARRGRLASKAACPSVRKCPLTTTVEGLYVRLPDPTREGCMPSRRDAQEARPRPPPRTGPPAGRPRRAQPHSITATMSASRWETGRGRRGRRRESPPGRAARQARRRAQARGTTRESESPLSCPVDAGASLRCASTARRRGRRGRRQVLPHPRLVVGLQRPIAAKLLKSDPSEQQRVGHLSLLPKRLVEVGLIDLLVTRRREPAFARVDDAVECDVLSDDELSHAWATAMMMPERRSAP
jgi:hypothetical protein